MAEEWGIPPWEVERRVPLTWLVRWRTLRAAQHKASKRAQKSKPGAIQVI